MPTLEDYFDDDTDIHLPAASGSGSGSASNAASGSGSGARARGLQGQGLQGALLEEINTDDPEDFALDYERIADQGRGIFGENSHAPPPGAGGDVGGKGKVAVRGNDNELRPAAGQAGAGNTPMGGFMGDMMKMQQLEEERLEKLRKQFGNTTIASDPSVYKELVLPPMRVSWF